MMTVLRRYSWLTLLLATLLGGTLLPTQAHAFVETNPNCPAEINDVGKKVPVLMVHGLFGNISTWGSDRTPGSMYEYLDLPILDRVTFDYSSRSDRWVTDPAIGPTLAKTIDCYAQASKNNGGIGKVIIIGHSMGGLAARFAASQTVNGRKVADEMGLVITLGTPHTGSDHGNAAAVAISLPCLGSLSLGKITRVLAGSQRCIPDLAVHGLSIGSRELAKLPPFPENIPVKAIAGNVTAQMNLGLAKITAASRNSDLIVTVPSATDEYTAAGMGGGKKIVSCTGFVMIPSFSDADCEHARLTTNTTIQEEVKTSIQEYVGIASQPITYFYGLGLRLGDDWELRDKDSYSGNKVILIRRDCTKPYKHLCPSVNIMPSSEEHIGDLSAVKVQPNETPCWGGTDHDDVGYFAPKYIGPTTVGGVSAKRYKMGNCNEINEPREGEVSFLWRVPSKKVSITEFEFENAEPVKGLENLLSTAVWQ